MACYIYNGQVIELEESQQIGEAKPAVEIRPEPSIVEELALKLSEATTIAQIRSAAKEILDKTGGQI